MDDISIGLVLFVAAWVVVMGGVAVAVGNKQRTFLERFLLGFIFGPLGWWLATKMRAGKSSEQIRAEWQARDQQREREKAEWKGERET